jgi:hypothetical protein
MPVLPLSLPNRYSLLPALCSDGIIYADVRASAYDGDAFVAYIDGLMKHMNPWPHPRSVLVMDNCAIHHVDEVAYVCAQRYVSLVSYALLLITLI